MRTLRAWLWRLGEMFHVKHSDQELAEELESHLQMQIEDNLRSGMTPDEARRQSLIKLGGLEQTKEAYRDRRGFPWLESLLQDIRFGLRMLRKNPGFTAVAVLTLALGIGATTAIFSVVNGVLLKPLPYPHPEQLVMVARTEPTFDYPLAVSGPNFLDWRSRATAFQALAGVDVRGFTITSGNVPERALGAAVSYGFLSVLRVTPALGRDFSEGEEHAGNDHVAIVTSAFWKQSLGADPNCIGRTVTINEHPFTVVGVLPAGFRYILFPQAEVFIPLNLDNQKIVSRGENFMRVIGRIKPGVSLHQAQSEMDSITRSLAREYPKEDGVQGAVVIPMLAWLGSGIRYALLILFSAVCLVLLIACANVGNLVLAQGVRRQHEIAVRNALGAGARRLIRQCFTESILLGALGGALGMLFGYFGLQAFRSLSPGNVPRLDDVRMDVDVLLFSLGISVLASILFGLVPALRISRTNLSDFLKEGATRATPGERRSTVRQTFVIAEIALSLILLAGAGLAIRSFVKLISTDPGYDPRNLLTFYVNYAPVWAAAPERELYSQLLEKIGAIPGVVSAAVSKSVPPSGGGDDGPIITSEHPDMDPHRAPDIVYNPISPNYFRTMRLRLLSGREFSEADAPGTAPAIILNEAAARSFFPGEDAVGQRVKLGRGDFATWWTVVGVVADEHYFGWDNYRRPMSYLPFSQALQDNAPDYDYAITLRTNSNPLSFLPAVRAAMASIDNQMVPVGPASMEERLGRTYAPRRFNMTLLAVFAGSALLLAAIGIYGVMAQFVAQRTHEIGIRMALGAQRGNILGIVLGSGARLAVIGVCIGTAGAFALTRLLSNLLFGVSPTDPVTFVAVAILLLLVALGACYIPARRAMRVDPMVALRYE